MAPDGVGRAVGDIEMLAQAVGDVGEGGAGRIGEESGEEAGGISHFYPTFLLLYSISSQIFQRGRRRRSNATSIPCIGDIP